MKLQNTFLAALVASGVTFSYAPKAEAALAAYVHITKNESPDTRFHLSEVEAFSSVTPDGLGGATFGGLATSTNDIGDGTLTTFGDGLLLPAFGTTTALEHGGGNKNPNNALESAGAVWSTANTQATNSQYTLDLGGTFDVTTVRIWPRADGCCGFRFQNLEIQLLDADLNPVDGTLQFHQTGGPAGNTPGEFTFAAVPEPSGVTLLSLASVALLLRRRR